MPRPEPPAARVILISIDTLRYDHLSVYGYPRPTTPVLEAMARESVVFENAMSQAPYTLPSHMTMFTGLRPLAHGVRFNLDRLSPNALTIAEMMQRADYRTGAFVDCAYLAPTYGFDQGFETYSYDPKATHRLLSGLRRDLPRIREWISKHAADPFFLFVHTFDCHGPYVVEPRYRNELKPTLPVVPKQAQSEADWKYIQSLAIHQYLDVRNKSSLAELIDTYDGTIRFVDSKLGEFFDSLRSAGLWDDSLIIVTSDHGESFLDHGIYCGHGLTLFEEEVHVPLIVKFPHGKYGGRRLAETVRHVDLLPTIAGAAHTTFPEFVQGIDLVKAIEGTDRNPRIAFGDSPNLTVAHRDGGKLVTYAKRQNIKYLDPPHVSMQFLAQAHLAGHDYDVENDPLGIFPRLRKLYATQLYDLDTDPLETKNVASRRPELVERIQARRAHNERESFDLFRSAAYSSADAAILTDDEIDALVQTGYLSLETARVRKLENARRLERTRVRSNSR